jgi:hypothetical protein
MILSINYADSSYKKHQRLNAFSARYFAKVDRTISYKPGDIDTDFRDKHAALLANVRGNGLWLWKPYFIQKSLDAIQENDYLIYTDSGVFYYRRIDALIRKMNDSNQDIMLFDLPLMELQWTRKSVFQALDMKIEEMCGYSNQRNAAIIIIKKTAKSTNFVKAWLDLCIQPDLLQPSIKSSDEEHILFVEHREDQSILSLLSKKWGIASFSDPSDFGKLPYLYLSKSKFVRIQKYKDEFKIDHTFFLHQRGANIIIYLIKFIFRYSIMKIIDPTVKNGMH